MPEVTTDGIVRCVSTDARGAQAALEDAACTDVAAVIELTFSGPATTGEALARAWWDAPARATAARLVSPPLPQEWANHWRAAWSEPAGRSALPPFRRRWRAAGEARACPGARVEVTYTGGVANPWELTLESGLSFTIREVEPLVVVNQGLSGPGMSDHIRMGAIPMPEVRSRLQITDDQCRMIVDTHRRSGWLFAIVEPGRVIAFSKLSVLCSGQG